jgi:hypothetical protein
MIYLSTEWPVKILLVHPQASFLHRKKVTVAADCSVLVNEGLSKRFRDGETVIIGCPLLEDPDRIMGKLALVLKETTAAEVEVYTMEVPYCHALHMMTRRAIKEAGKENIEAKYSIVRIVSGDVEPYRTGVIDKAMVEAERRAHGYETRLINEATYFYCGNF